MAGFDPFGESDPFKGNDIFKGGTGKPGPSAAYRAPLPKDQADGMMAALGGYSSGALQQGLSALDKPGRAVRGLLSGKIREVGNLIPFSDTMGLTDEKDRVSGRDLVDGLGITSKGDKGWLPWGAGLAAEIATDPLTYATFGANHAVTGAGKVAKGLGATKGWTRKAMLEGFHATEPALRAAGRSTEEIAHAVAGGQRVASQAVVDGATAAGHSIVPGQALSGLAQIGIPFGPKLTLPAGGKSLAVAGGLDKAADYLRYGNPIGRAAGALFDPSANGAVGAMTQKAWAAHGMPAQDAARAVSRGETFDVTHALSGLIDGGAPERDILKATRMAQEGVPMVGIDPALAGQVQGTAGTVGTAYERMMAEARKVGLPLGESGDQFAKYGHRQGVDAKALAGKQGAQLKASSQFPVVSGSNIMRADPYRNIPGGTEHINDLAMRFAGKPADNAMVRSIKKELYTRAVAGGTLMSPALGKQLDSSAASLATRFASLDPIHAAEQIPLFSPNIAGDVARRGEQHARTIASAQAALGAIGDNAASMAALGPDGIPVSMALKKLGLRTFKGDAATGAPIQGALAEVYRKLAKQGAGPVDPLLGGPRKALRQAADKFGITPQQFDELAKAHGKWAAPEEMKAPLRGFDSVTNAFKGLTYPTWIPSHVRNLFSGGLNNVISGGNAADHALQLKLMRQTATAGELRALMPHIPAGATDDEARTIFRRAQHADAGVYGGHHASTDQNGLPAALANGDRITPQVPGTGAVGTTGSVLGDSLKHIGGGYWDQLKATGGKLATARPLGLLAPSYAKTPLGRLNPANWFDPAKPWGLGMSGVGGRTVDTMPMLKAGRVAGQHTEDFLRGSNYVGNLRQGMAGPVAGEAVNKLHFDYDKLTGFEKQVMRRAVPFYTYARKNLPLQLGQAATKPGTTIAQMRLMSSGKAAGEYVPQYLSSGAAVPLGDGAETADGAKTKRYISSFGTPLEEALERIKFKGGLPDAKGTALGYLGTMNPLIKAPLEQLFNTQFHSGRRLTDLRAPRTVSALGNMVGEDNPQLLAQVFANSPMTRFISSADKAIDERKPWWAKAANMLSGVKITDIEPEKIQAVEAAQARNEMLERMPHVKSHESFYVRPEDQGKLRPDEVAMMRMLRTMQQSARENAAEKKGSAASRIGIKGG